MVPWQSGHSGQLRPPLQRRRKQTLRSQWTGRLNSSGAKEEERWGEQADSSGPVSSSSLAGHGSRSADPLHPSSGLCQGKLCPQKHAGWGDSGPRLPAEKTAWLHSTTRLSCVLLSGVRTETLHYFIFLNYFRLCRVFIPARALLWLRGAGRFLVAVQGLLIAAALAVAHRLSCFAACRIFLGRESNAGLLHWQADCHWQADGSLPLSHHGSPIFTFLRDYHPIFHSSCASFLSHQQCMSVPTPPHPQECFIFSFNIKAIPIGKLGGFNARIWFGAYRPVTCGRG